MGSLDFFSCFAYLQQIFAFSFPFHVLIGELGDCDPLEHSVALVSEFRFSPKQTEIMEADIYRKWAECR